MDNRLPIVYLRGYAGPTAGIDAAVSDPLYGFGAGATHVRMGCATVRVSVHSSS